MLNLLNPFRPYLKLIAIGAVTAAFLATYVKGRSDGKSALVAKLASERVEILKDGRKVDAEVLSADDNQLCILLGGCSDGVSDNESSD